MGFVRVLGLGTLPNEFYLVLPGFRPFEMASSRDCKHNLRRARAKFIKMGSKIKLKKNNSVKLGSQVVHWFLVRWGRSNLASFGRKKLEKKASSFYRVLPSFLLLATLPMVCRWKSAEGDVKPFVKLGKTR